MFFIWNPRMAFIVRVAELLMLPAITSDWLAMMTVFEASDSVL